VKRTKKNFSLIIFDRMDATRNIKLKILRYLSFTRVLNASKLIFSYSLSRLLKRPVLMGLPISIGYEPTTSCNLRCPECPSGLRSFSRPTGNSDLIAFKNLIDQVKGHVMYLNLYFQGEPYLNPDLYEMAAYAKKARIITSTSTNAHYLSPENCRKTIDSGLDKLIISLDGISTESYQKYRVGGDLDKVKSGVFALVKLKKELKVDHPEIIIQTIAFSHNEHELDQIRKLKKKWGVDHVQIKTAQVYSVEDSHLLPKDTSLSRYRWKDGSYELPSELPNRCWRMWTSPVLTQDGELIPCCFDKDADHKMGNPVKEGDFKKVWTNDTFNEFRKQVFSDRKKNEICKNCSEGVKVWN
jgi:radical SAM protein with 4Fe4S-binding SPASM domain